MKDEKKIIENPKVDEWLRNELKKQLRQDAGNPYFTRKVLNRLPPKPRREPALWILRAAYLVATVLLSAFWLRLTLHGDMFGHDLPTFVTLWLLTLLLCFSGLQGVTRRWLL